MALSNLLYLLFDRYYFEICKSTEIHLFGYGILSAMIKDMDRDYSRA